MDIVGCLSLLVIVHQTGVMHPRALLYLLCPHLLGPTFLDLVIYFFLKSYLGWVVAVYTFNPRSQEAEAGRSLEFKANLVYRASSRTGKATQRNSVMVKKKIVSVE